MARREGWTAMGIYVGIDLGSTTLSGVVLDPATREVVTQETVPNEAEVTSTEDRERDRSEWDLERMVESALALIGRLASGRRIEAVGVTGQQHGMALLDRLGTPVSPFIGWQDRRCNEPLSDGRTTVQRMLEQGGEMFRRSGCVPATGYMASTLFWLVQRGELPAKAVACFAPDHLVGRLCGKDAITDPTLAASAGVFDVERGEWNAELVEVLGLPLGCLPEVRTPCTRAGGLSRDAAALTGLPEGTPVATPCGDNQASFAGSVGDPARSVLVNIGTGGQTSVYVEQALFVEGLDLRPFLQPGFLLVGAGLAGGRSYRMLRDFVREIGRQLFGIEDLPNLYERLTQLAVDAPAGCDGLTCEPIFAGTRHEPDRRAVWRGMSEE
ncbi:MAG: hypothetical protein FJX74_01600, partial [Armatimonadetes bacterium]|nr:hypothetical protein [Armatimonadota bacterium]